MVFDEYGKQGISLKRAYEMHDQPRSDLERGLDPIEERSKRDLAMEQVRAVSGRGAVADIVAQFVHRKFRAERRVEQSGAWVREKKARTKPRKRPEVAESLLKANLVDKIGTETARDITRRQLINLLDDIVDRGSKPRLFAPQAMLRIRGVQGSSTGFPHAWRPSAWRR